MDYLIILLVIGGFILPFVAFSYLKERNRSRKMGKVAQELGLNYYPSDFKQQLRRQFALFYLFDKGSRGRISNYMEAEQDKGLHIAIFDYQYYARSGEQTRIVKQSVAHLASEQLNTPMFRLHPKSLWKKIKYTLFQKQDIDFSSHPSFSSTYRLSGPEEQEIREYFEEERISYFSQHKGWSMEVFPHRILLYKSGVRLKPKEIPAFKKEALEVFEVLS